jgi:hypothetical protein
MSNRGKASGVLTCLKDIILLALSTVLFSLFVYGLYSSFQHIKYLRSCALDFIFFALVFSNTTLAKKSVANYLATFNPNDLARYASESMRHAALLVGAGIILIVTSVSISDFGARLPVNITSKVPPDVFSGASFVFGIVIVITPVIRLAIHLLRRQ